MEPMKQPKHIKSDTNPIPEDHIFPTVEVVHRKLHKMVHRDSGNEALVNEERIEEFRARGYQTEADRQDTAGKNAIAKALADAAKAPPSSSDEMGMDAQQAQAEATPAPKPKKSKAKK